jgi:hypothetical protein
LIDSTNDSTLNPNKTQQLTNRQSKVWLLVGKGRGAKVPKNGTFNVLLGLTASE